MRSTAIKMALALSLLPGICMTGHSHNTVLRTETELFREEADRFLAGLPANLQQQQAEAVEKATNGDCAALDAVRSSRNATHPLPDNVIAEQIAPGLKLYRPANATGTLPTLVYFHGGGWCFGSINSCARFCSGLAATGKAIVIAADYPLAPENRYPIGLNFCVEAVEFALTNAADWGSSPELVSVGGDSSGGNLAIAATMRLANQNHRVKSLVLFYPVVKAFCDNSPSWSKYGNGFGLDSNLMDAFNKAYTTTPGLPDISVADAGDWALSQLPDILLIAAERDILRDQGREFAKKLESLNVGITRIEIPGAVHLFITVPGQDAAFNQSVALTAHFLSPGKE